MNKPYGVVYLSRKTDDVRERIEWYSSESEANQAFAIMSQTHDGVALVERIK